jgi:hypothetical protein
MTPIVASLLLLLALSVGLNVVLYLSIRRAERTAARAAGASVLNQALAGELERKLGPRKAARLIRSTVNTVKQQAVTKGV